MRAPRQPPPLPRRGQARDLTSRQKELLDQIESIYLSEGFSHLTIDDLVSRLRCSKVTVYALAPSREELTLAVLRRFFDQVEGLIESRVDDSDDSYQRVAQFLAGTVEGMRRMSPRCFNDIVHYSTTKAIYDSFSRSTIDRLTDLLVKTRAVTGRNGRIPFIAELVRLVLDDIFGGELEARTGISIDNALGQLTAIAMSTLTLPSKNSPGSQITRLK